MKSRKSLGITAGVTILSFLLAACAPAATPAPATKAQAPVATPAPTSQAQAPAPTQAPPAKPAAPSAPSPTAKPSADQPRYGGVLNIPHFSDPPSYDPVQESSITWSAIVAPEYSGIVQRDPMDRTKVVGDLAEKWDIGPDGLTYTFQLHKSVKWHDGSDFSAEDARFTLETVRKPPEGVVSARKDLLRVVDKIEASAKDTLKITLQNPSASFILNLADSRLLVIPKRVFEAKGNLKKDIVGTGPYRFKSHEAGSAFSVIKNPSYFMKGRPYLDGITWYIIRDAATRFAALRTHRVQVTAFGTYGLTPSQGDIARREMGDKVDVQRYSGLAYLALWMPLSKAPWSDIRVRKAVEMTIDRPKMIKAALEGRGDLGLYMPPGAWSLPEDELMKLPGFRQPKDADIAEAKRLLAEAGFPNGLKTSTITIGGMAQENAAISLKDQLSAIGIDITVSLKDTAGIYDLLYKRSFDTAAFTGTASDDDPDQILTYFTTGTLRNFSDFSDEKLDKWFDEQSRTLDVAKRKSIVLDMQRRMAELVPASILYWTVYELGSWKEVRDLKPGNGLNGNLKFQNVWLAR